MTDWTRQFDSLNWSEHALFLDFDGTLAPIVPRPADAVIDRRTREALDRMREKTRGALAILSGRDLDDLDQRLAPLRLPAAGSHGMELRDVSGRHHLIGAGSATLNPVVAGLTAFAEHEGLLVERKAGAVAIHYRGRPELANRCREIVEGLAAASDTLRAVHGHQVSEVVLRGIDKGRALRAFLAQEPFAGRVPVAVGDDTTDEDAFSAAQGAGGLGIKIGPGDTCALLRLPGIKAFLDCFHRVAMGDAGTI